ncbi:lipoprotein-anchoring transpeptidase ErfK/SrfK [Rhodoligotrophos appendicifer]|uniref:L,D-transpeptidase family protein n=1 Tax=Rhodoligotrophos appendicifer TaxID=987056 RepID=UPI001FE92F18|nr:L,D-transpeptidase [Rhodoligotrophos appendicifer]
MIHRCWVCLLGLMAIGMSAQAQEPKTLTLEAINSVSLDSLMERGAVDTGTAQEGAVKEIEQKSLPNPAIARLQILLDRAGASPAVIDGFDGENVSKAIRTFEALNALPVDGILDEEVIDLLETKDPVVTRYTISAEDVSEIVDPLPTDYAELAKLKFLGFTSVAEALSEKFHMDLDFLKALNPQASFSKGEQIVVAIPGKPIEGTVARMEADKKLGQLRAYDAQDKLLVAYPATVGSDDNPSPKGKHKVAAIAPNPNYTYNPDVNFQQGQNTKALILAPGPNNPVGTMWIDLTEPTYGIHGTPEPSEIDKTASHGCIRLTNWDAEELAGMVKKGVTVTFVQ